jgi:hypothetical protein
MAPTAQKLDPVTLALMNAPVSEEPLTEEDIAAIEQAKEDARNGRLISSEELMKELGIDP